MTWILTAAGREHDLANPPASGYTLGEIAHALAHINRYTGHTCRAYSVAEHSLLVADMVHAAGYGPTAELCGLMHDAHEVFCGDVASPIKPLLGEAWATLETMQQLAVLRAFGLLEAMADYAAVVRKFDLVALTTERRDLLPFDLDRHALWPVIDTPGREIAPWNDAALMAPSCVLRTPREWALRFEKRARTLADEAEIELPI